mmetsp:Transcript_34029/g.105075  ORF Transcript_34029/g.105075 Transcript_34029/m.105075 type:complete len:287 (-) Transcript_34029:1611-2471(-)
MGSLHDATVRKLVERRVVRLERVVAVAFADDVQPLLVAGIAAGGRRPCTHKREGDAVVDANAVAQPHREVVQRGLRVTGDALRDEREQAAHRAVVEQAVLVLQLRAAALQRHGVHEALAHRGELARAVAAEEPGVGLARRHADGQRRVAGHVPARVAERVDEGRGLVRRRRAHDGRVERDEVVVPVEVVERTAVRLRHVEHLARHVRVQLGGTLGGRRPETPEVHHDDGTARLRLQHASVEQGEPRAGRRHRPRRAHQEAALCAARALARPARRVGRGAGGVTSLL